MNRYDAIYLAWTPVTVPYFLFKYLFRGKYHESYPAMRGRRLPSPALSPETNRVGGRNADGPARGASGNGGPVVWVHAVSVGEVVAARCVIPYLREALPGMRLFVSTITETGQATARQTLASEADEIFYYPLDFSWHVNRFLDVYRPNAFVMLETELWPNMLTLAGGRGVKIFLLNGRLSDRSYPWYRRFRFLFREPLSRLRACAVQTETDAQRLRALCGPDTPIEVTGNCKFDTPAALLSGADKAALREKCGLSDGRFVVVAGSTHPGEEEIVLTAWDRAAREFPNATLIVAPRHPERFDEAARIVARHSLTVSRSSQTDKPRDPQVFLLDEMGVLARLYAIASVAIVCGSFVPIGGHNILEPAAHGVPVVYGPHMRKQMEMARIINADRGGVQVAPDGLSGALLSLMRDETLRARMGEAARQAVEANRGSARRSVEFILPFLKA